MLAGRAGLLGADEAAARVREEARLMRERAAEARSRLQSTHVSTWFCLLSVANCMLLAAASRTGSQNKCMHGQLQPHHLTLAAHAVVNCLHCIRLAYCS